VFIPSSVEVIQIPAFAGCPGLRAIDVATVVEIRQID
jgi:hypothetical protein